MRRTSDPGKFEITATSDLKDGLNVLLRSYPASHNARTQIVRFRSRIEGIKMKVSFLDAEDDVEFVHTRHPLVLLARHLTREPLSDIPYCVGAVSTTSADGTKVLVWAVGSLEGLHESRRASLRHGRLRHGHGQPNLGRSGAEVDESVVHYRRRT